jgi:glycolate oxidase FAD binding subunit
VRTLEPRDLDEAAAMVADASRAGTPLAIRGGGTKWEWSATASADPSTVDLTLSTRGLQRILAHRHGDLTATVECGATLADVNRALAQHRQWIPLDPPWSDRATIGGIVATNDSGPRRHRFGAPRDLIIGIEIARADGVRAKAGGIVVKNVAGYDLARLMTGSFGCLGIILTATFKLYPIPAASRTVVAELPTASAAGSLALALNGSQLTPTAVEVETPPLRMLVRFESTEPSVDEQSAQTLRLVEGAGGRGTIVGDDGEAREWQAHDERPWRGSGAVVKVTTLPAQLGETIDAIARAASGSAVEIAGRAGLGVLLVRLDSPTDLQVRAIAALRERCRPGHGSVVVLRASDELRSAVDVWGPMGDSFRVMQAVKRSFDPRGILNPRRGPGGL